LHTVENTDTEFAPHETKKRNFRRIIEGCALALCVLFFVCPLVKCSQSDLAVSGWEIAIGTGDLYGEKIVEGNPLVFALIIFPAALLILAFIDKPFVVLRMVSIAGLAAKIIFLIAAYMKINSGYYKGGFELTGGSWFILSIYIGLVCFTQYCVNFINEAKKNLKKDIFIDSGNRLQKKIKMNRVKPFLLKVGISIALALLVLIVNWVGRYLYLEAKTLRIAEAEALRVAKIRRDDLTMLTDSRDGKKYIIVKIGKQTWMAENLNYNANGSKCYGNSESICQGYGRLYDWSTAKSACPKGWHLPSNAEWTALTDFVGGSAVIKLKAKSGWSNNGNGTDEFGFSALPGGIGYSNGGFDYVGSLGYWWSASEGDAANAWYWYIGNVRADVYSSSDGKTKLYSVRCVQD
jgi:uncharacterized protein (TIGR02145 family)